MLDIQLHILHHDSEWYFVRQHHGVPVPLQVGDVGGGRGRLVQVPCGCMDAEPDAVVAMHTAAASATGPPVAETVGTLN